MSAFGSGLIGQNTDVGSPLKYNELPGLGYMRLKSLGTITACFPHVDEETRSVLQAVMDEAKDYNEFAELLCERVSSQSSPILLNYFAYFHAYNQQRFNLIRDLEKKVTISDLAKPLMLLTHPWGNIDWGDFQKSVALAIKSAPNDWIACHVYMIWRGDIEAIEAYPERLTDLEPLRILESRIESDDDFSFFRTALNHLRARGLNREDKIEEAKYWYDQAITLAKKHDCRDQVAVLLYEKANMIKNMNSNEALSILEIQRSISEELGFDYALSLNEQALGLIAQARGEYESAIKHYNLSIEFIEFLGLVSLVDFQKCQIARQYNQMQDGKRALEITTDVLQRYQSDIICYPYIQEAWALLNLNRIDEATQRLDIAKEWAPKSGVDWLFGMFHLLEGLVHVKRNELSSAKFELEQANSIFRSFPLTNLTLIPLTRVEIEMFPYEKEVVKADVSGPWMQALIEQVEEKDIPGIAAQALLLKAKYRFNQGRIAEANELFEEVLKTSKTSGMDYLKSMAESLLPELIVP
jgi:tetratricopeptide (TPR) repeat protein